MLKLWCCSGTGSLAAETQRTGSREGTGSETSTRTALVEKEQMQSWSKFRWMSGKIPSFVGRKPIKLWQRDYRFLESVLSVTVSEIKKNKQKKRSGS